MLTEAESRRAAAYNYAHGYAALKLTPMTSIDAAQVSVASEIKGSLAGVSSPLSKLSSKGAVEGEYVIVANRFAESPDATVSTFTATGPEGESVSGYFLEPGGPSTTKRGMDKRIPAGKYTMEWTYSSSFKKNMYLISNSEVPADRGIRLHTGNNGNDTEGCLLPGYSYNLINGNYYITGSRETYQNLMNLLKKNATILIINDIP